MNRIKSMILVVMVSLLVVGGFPLSASADEYDQTVTTLSISYCSILSNLKMCDSYKTYEGMDFGTTGWRKIGLSGAVHDVKPGDRFPDLPIIPSEPSEPDIADWWGDKSNRLGFACTKISGSTTLNQFDGWHPLSEWSQQIVPETAKMGYYSCLFGLEPNKSVVNFDYGHDGQTSSVVVETGKTLSQPEQPVWADHNFKGWYKGDELYDFSKPVEEGFTLVAKWEEKPKFQQISSMPMTGSHAILILLFLWVFLAVFWLVSWLLRIRRKR